MLLFVSGIFLLVMKNQFDGIGCGLCAVLLVIGALNLKKWRSTVLHELENGSCSIYLTHIFTLGLVRFLWMKTFPEPITPFSGLSFMLLSLTTCAIIGCFFYRWIEYLMTKSLHARIGNT
jgi:peptidoglycan/LPS O-acetylase OafA/YrhL